MDSPRDAEPYPMTVRDRFLDALALKALPRAGWVRIGITEPESVAAHSWGVAWLALVLCPPELDRARVLELAIVHDLPEVHAGDITPHDGVAPADKRDAEARSLARLTRGLPDSGRLTDLWLEYESGETPEARFVKACDKLDMALQAAVYGQHGPDTTEFVDSALRTLAGTDLEALARG